jgi:hypothetical protein
MAERGRPTDYKPEFAEQAAKLCALGATDYELADFFGVDTRTIYRWKNVHDDFCQSVTCGKERADERVERALFNRAVGYTFESEKVFQFQGEVIRADTVEHVPPDPGAAKLWLTNRRPEQWREKQEIDHKSSDGSMTPARIELVALAPLDDDNSTH